MVCTSLCGARQFRVLCVSVSSRTPVGFNVSLTSGLSLKSRFVFCFTPWFVVLLRLHAWLQLHQTVSVSRPASAISFSVMPGSNFSTQFRLHVWLQLQQTGSVSRLASTSAFSFNFLPGFSFSVQFQLLAWFLLQRSREQSFLLSVTPKVNFSTSA